MPPIRLFSEILSRLPGVVHGFSAPAADEATHDPPCRRPRQVHGTHLVEWHEVDSEPPEADGVLCGAVGVRVGIVTADCVPVLLASRDGSRVAAVHAGWRGISAGILEAAVDRLDSADWRAALGPAAAGCCYRVGPEVLDALRPAEERVTEHEPSGHARLDLRAVALDRLSALAPAADRIETVGPCTICSHEWPSYRRQGAEAERAVAWIGRTSLSLRR